MRRPTHPYPRRNWREVGTPSRWDQYFNLLTRKGIAAKARRWYVARAEAFLKTLRPDSLKDLTKEQITAYLQAASTTGDLLDWQFRQSVDAIELLIVDLAQLPVGTVAASTQNLAYNARARGRLHNHGLHARAQQPGGLACKKPGGFQTG